ncbi:hypothetical protein BXZ70DRAFT_953261 [Cristinia sonorae]|uniref:Uncharacterized protein n=1 Tax=Cristinia sonorae TaxID=1940300 RepID=A0A8K0XLS2_9AGAR|nr:hypothetical protein BXZ70DRAFT_953261 [Cristinia sonorae]
MQYLNNRACGEGLYFQPGGVSPASRLHPGGVSPASRLHPGGVSPASRHHPGGVSPASRFQPGGVSPASRFQPGGVSPGLGPASRLHPGGVSPRMSILLLAAGAALATCTAARTAVRRVSFRFNSQRTWRWPYCGEFAETQLRQPKPEKPLLYVFPPKNIGENSSVYD